MARIFLDKVTKIFKPNVVAVNDLTLDIPDRRIVALLGPSGCGKTTTMRIISGLEKPTKGRVFFDDQDVTEVPVEERDVAMVFQFPIVYPALSVFGNIAFPLRARRLSKSETTRMVKEVADLLNLSSVLDKKPSGLDAGAKQRVAIARAIVRRPKIYLFDEPLTNLDPTERVQLRFELKRLQKDLGQTIIFVTHDQAEALTMGDKIGVMNEGSLLQYDTPENVYDNPQNRFVAYFIGNPGMNLIECTFEESGTGAFLEANGFSFDITDIAENIRKHSSSTEVILGIRPEYVEVSTEKQGRNWISSRCVVAEELGNRTLVDLNLGEITIRAKTSLPKITEMVWLNLPKKHIRVFDKKTGKLIA